MSPQLGRSRTPFRTARAWLASVLLVAFSVGPASADDDAVLKEVVAEVQRQEQRYANIAVELKETYDIGDRQPSSGPNASETIRTDTRTEFVAQGEWFRCEMKGTGLNPREVFTIDRLTAFDGEKTRRLDYTYELGSISSERSVAAAYVQPHLLIDRSADLAVPLSTYLGGTGSPDFLDQKLSLRVSYRGEETYDGLVCHKVFVETLLKSGKVHDARLFWLAKERNLLPARQLAYTYRFSTDEPVGESRVNEWREIEPGLWFPIDVHCTAHDKLAIQRKEAKKLRWRTHTVVTKVELDPKHERKFFSNVEFPKGTKMTEYDQGRVVRSWRQE